MRVKEMGIVYAPDFMINAGGLMNCYVELHGYNKDKAMRQAEEIYNTTQQILKRAAADNLPTYRIANQMAEERIEAIGKVKLSY